MISASLPTFIIRQLLTTLWLLLVVGYFDVFLLWKKWSWEKSVFERKKGRNFGRYTISRIFITNLNKFRQKWSWDQFVFEKKSGKISPLDNRPWYVLFFSKRNGYESSVFLRWLGVVVAIFFLTFSQNTRWPW